MLATSDDSDILILDKIKVDNVEGWEALYNTYAASMLGIICRLTLEKTKGEDILIKMFTGAEFKIFIKTIHSKLSVQLCRYAFCFAAKELRTQQLLPSESTIKQLPSFLQTLYKASLNSSSIQTFKLTKSVNIPAIGFSIIPIVQPGIYA